VLLQLAIFANGAASATQTRSATGNVRAVTTTRHVA
jgi:hypothetical protein